MKLNIVKHETRTFTNANGDVVGAPEYHKEGFVLQTSSIFRYSPYSAGYSILPSFTAEELRIIADELDVLNNSK